MGTLRIVSFSKILKQTEIIQKSAQEQKAFIDLTILNSSRRQLRCSHLKSKSLYAHFQY
ncbi:protein of unknown function [Denitratisoma oestradiolicum]|uniref:Uncharacterized protein n=1 Tax=Denitratisoma oestradiolicum TaxID=311182 RepID=A0A6S6XW87_9PROT|nr:protein of unknown function [Denitratisoma oestradiolicum]